MMIKNNILQLKTSRLVEKAQKSKNNLHPIDNREFCNKQYFLKNKLIQRQVTADATVTVEYDSNSISETGFGASFTDYTKNETIFIPYFIKNIQSKTLDQISKDDNWPEVLTEKKRDLLGNVRKPIDCAEPHAVINALSKVKLTGDENITNVTFDIKNIMNRHTKGIEAICPCAVCKQWINTVNKGSGSGTFRNWIKDPLLGWSLKIKKK